MTTTVVLAPKQHRKRDVAGGLKAGRGREGLEGAGRMGLVCGESFVLQPREEGAVGSGDDAPKVPTSPCCPQHPGDAGIWAGLPFIAASSI